MRKNNFLKITTYAAVFGLIGGMSFEGTTYISNKYLNKSAVESTSSTTKSIDNTKTLSSTSTKTSSSDGVSGISENVLPSIVAIDVKTTETSTDVFGRTYKQDASGSGSGIIVAQDSKNIYIATNNHVVADANSVSVTFNDKSVYSAVVKGTDSDSDLAVIEQYKSCDTWRFKQDKSWSTGYRNRKCSWIWDICNSRLYKCKRQGSIK